jgi:hypothetical protein
MILMVEPTDDQIENAILTTLKVEYPDGIAPDVLFSKVLQQLPDIAHEKYEIWLKRLMILGHISRNYDLKTSPDGGKKLGPEYRLTASGIELSLSTTVSDHTNQIELSGTIGTKSSVSGTVIVETKAEKIMVSLAKQYDKMLQQMDEMQKRIDDHEKEIEHYFTRTIEIFAAFVGIFAFIVVYLNTVIPHLPSDTIGLITYSITIVIILLASFYGMFLILNRLVLNRSRTK